MFAAPVGAPEKVCVEAETDPGGGVVLTLCDIRLRRQYVQERGRHTVTLSADALQGYGFPMHFFKELKKGYPVRFRMNRAGFEALLGSGGLGGLTHKESKPFRDYARAQEEAVEIRTQGAAEVWIEKRRDGWVVHSLVQDGESGGEFSFDGLGGEKSEDYEGYWFLDITYAMDTPDLRSMVQAALGTSNVDSALREIAGRHHGVFGGSGAGFGGRDLTFLFPSGEYAEAALSEMVALGMPFTHQKVSSPEEVEEQAVVAKERMRQITARHPGRRKGRRKITFHGV